MEEVDVGREFNRKTILVVDDEESIVDLLVYHLKKEGYDTLEAYDGASAVDIALKEKPDLILLDVMLPKMDGISVCKRIRYSLNVPILMISAKDTELDKVVGLEMGADDYITKPFLPLELVARVKAQLRRYKKYNVGAAVPAADEIFKYAGLTMNIKTYECRLNGETLSLTPTEFSILRILLERKCSVVSAEELFHEVWQEEYYTKSNNTITVHIRHLREKMKDTGENPRYIKTVWGVGYKIGEI